MLSPSPTSSAICHSLGSLPCSLLCSVQSFLSWSEQLALMLVSQAVSSQVHHPYVLMAKRHYRSADGVPLEWQEAHIMHEASRRKGCEVVELAIMAHRDALLTIGIPTFLQIADVNREGFLHHARGRFWPSDEVRRAHADIMQAIKWSKFSMAAAAANNARTMNSMADVCINDYNNYNMLILSNIIQEKDAQVDDIALRTCMPTGYVYYFASMLVYYRLCCAKQMELLAF